MQKLPQIDTFDLSKTSISIPELLEKCCLKNIKQLCFVCLKHRFLYLDFSKSVSNLAHFVCLKHRFLVLNFSKYKTPKSLRNFHEQENLKKSYRSSSVRGGGSLVSFHIRTWKCFPSEMLIMIFQKFT